MRNIYSYKDLSVYDNRARTNLINSIDNISEYTRDYINKYLISKETFIEKYEETYNYLFPHDYDINPPHRGSFKINKEYDLVFIEHYKSLWSDKVNSTKDLMYKNNTGTIIKSDRYLLDSDTKESFYFYFPESDSTWIKRNYHFISSHEKYEYDEDAFIFAENKEWAWYLFEEVVDFTFMLVKKENLHLFIESVKNSEEMESILMDDDFETAFPHFSDKVIVL